MSLKKWRELEHLRVACAGHSQDLLRAALSAQTSTMLKELVDLSIILELAFESEDIESMRARRMERFQATADLPPLKWEEET